VSFSEAGPAENGEELSQIQQKPWIGMAFGGSAGFGGRAFPYPGRWEIRRVGIWSCGNR
jgi:hypothetical protein